MHFMKLIQLSQKDLVWLRQDLLIKQDSKCAICGCDVTDKSHIDHKHKTSKEINGVNGAGLVRGLLCPNCNLLLGKIENNAKRFQRSDNLPELLINISRYIVSFTEYIHPSEKPKEPKVSKRQFNKLLKLEPKAKYSTKLNQKLKKLFDKHNINPYIES